MKLIPIRYHSKRYPPNIRSNIEEIAGNLDKSVINPRMDYSLHTEYSYMKRDLDNKLINKYEHLKNSHKNQIPQLWKDKNWAKEYAYFIIDLIGNNKAPTIIEIHPPFNDYCETYNKFFEIYTEFEKIITSKFPNVKILIENRNGTQYRGGKFLISNGESIINFLEELKKQNTRLRLVLDYPQLFSAENRKMDNLNVDKIVEFNKNLKKHASYVDGFHLWGKRKSDKGRWAAHTGDLNSFFSNNKENKEKFLKSLIETFNDDIPRYFVPEVNSSERDLHSIIKDLLKYNVTFKIENKQPTMIELDEKYIFHIPLYKYENNELVKINITDILDDLINQLNQEGYDSLYIMKVKGYYKSRGFDELLLTIFISEEQLKRQNQDSPEIVFKDWFKINNNILRQEALAYECNNKMFICEI